MDNVSPGLVFQKLNNLVEVIMIFISRDVFVGMFVVFVISFIFLAGYGNNFSFYISDSWSC